MLRSGALANKHVLLIDDIATTGSTLSAAAATLEAAGATVVAAAVVAHTVKLVS
jgi:predicted amidophosphoribosyltransferase